ncbi:MAG: calcium-translocating P-type ATPase, SERCA-type [Candidatus Nanoarchaeia archaeon]|nr:calcium-translocating P-type ATPase, SERCA-type [Candidatus Nanoarchaeia archaeon]MDD5587566.1 calcium-translocating P-type ATPase, SERCA-type [Candidatus Nanoarchaeia archaeon]
MPFYDKSTKEVLDVLNTDLTKGLTEKEASDRLEKYGLNSIKAKESKGPIKIFLSQFTNILVIILVVVALISLFIGRFSDFVLILVILLLNAILGFVQEYKAEKALKALKKLAAFKANIIRDGIKKTIDSEELVPGDIILIEQGSNIPADARLIEAINLKLDESILTGESLPVEKNTDKLKSDIVVSDQKNMIFSSTTCVYGHAKAVVVETGMQTEIGKIAYSLKTIKETETPLQINIKKLGTFISIAIVLICLITFCIGYYIDRNLIDTFLVATSLAVAAIPEGLPAIITITLALGLQRMLKRNSLIRKLNAVETLGSTTVIATDKTGTITKNEMTVKEIFINDELVKVTGEGYDIKGDFLYNNRKIDIEELQPLMQVAYSCNNADLEYKSGDPTELALLTAVAKSNLKIKPYLRIKEIPFSNEKKFMATSHRIKDREVYYFKGAPEKIMEFCSYYYINGRTKWFGKEEREEILKTLNNMGSRALRVLAFAYSKTDKPENLVFVGLMGMIDPPRPEVKDAIDLCERAGIKVIMITGDHKETAKAIAQQVGIKGKVITGEQLDKLSKKDFKSLIDDIAVYARVTPKHKLRIVEALQEKEHVVAMTGDGVNDAPALKAADIGIAVERGTDIAKQESDMILLDNNFASIVAAVKEGRGIYSNIKKFINYLLSCNLGEILTIFIATIIGLPLMLLPIQILWINLITDGLPALALGLEPIEKDIMTKPPRKKKESIITKSNIINMSLIAILMAIGTLFIFKLYNYYYNLEYARTMAFSTLVMFQMFNAVNSRSESSVFKAGLFTNKKLLYALGLSILLQLIIIYFSSSLFGVVSLKLIDWIYVLLISASVFVFVEIKKFLK